MDYFQYSKSGWDERMQPAIDFILKKRNKNGPWNVNRKYPGKQHFEMAKSGTSTRSNALRAMRILKHFEIKVTQKFDEIS